ncbi:MAG TPA: class I ribonucleotide reductase maintenance protein YfaE [Marinospirillum sp.]|uniref:class I ribonucleotide reductase maintenance protein YfaE n=1 Tax=Marinospirillum sp. TaxID=2183934 RepID=UPI002B49281F|nr:class I ribonucleotide reductase maintenance protein YfaE [Marinospirillum sp.]HKM14367.1 class I ribonucleotide reductase maintenance protein YfaE [Marinospirillum sp.]
MGKYRQISTEDLIFELGQSETLLEGLERTGHQVEYQCRSGYCGSCRVTLHSGSVKYETEPLAYLRRGEVLACCCRPLEPLVVSVGLITKTKKSA